MKPCVILFGAALMVVVTLHAQMVNTGQTDDGVTQTQEAPTPSQATASRTFVGHHALVHKAKSARAQKLVPLTPRERAVQMLDRFTFGARPGDVDKVAVMGPDKWLEQQLNPGTINDGRLNKRLAEYPTLALTAEQSAAIFPDNGRIYAVANGKRPYPTDLLLHSVYEVQVFKWRQERNRYKTDGKASPPPDLSDEQVAAQKAKDKATAARIAGDLFALPKDQRMAALMAMPVEDRIAFTGNGNLQGEQRTQLLADFTPREREAFVAMSTRQSSSGYIGSELAQARVLRDILSERQLQQVMTDFWFNHFNVYVPKGADEWYTTSYVRDVIRAHALGTFKDLLLATAESPAMQVYLDNYLSIGPDSLANGVNPKNRKAKRGNRGLNENYGREIMELHTLGVTGGYTQADVTALSAILTGWGIKNPAEGGGFAFDWRKHEPGTKYWYGYEIKDDGTMRTLAPGETPKVTFGPGTPGFSTAMATHNSMKQGLAALTILADSPHTAHFISTLLAQYFVADNPPRALVDRLTKTYLASGGDIKTMLRTIAESREFNSRQYFRNKVKTPEEFVASAFRTTATDPVNPNSLVGRIRQMGMPLYDALPPTGYYLTADQWMSSTALVDRLNFSYNLVTNRIGGGQKFDAPKLLALGLMTATETAQLSNRAARPVASERPPSLAHAKPIAFARVDGSKPALAVSKLAPATATPGAQMTLRVLESTVIGAPISSQTNQLIHMQLDQQPANENPVDTLNLLTALVLGSPEFQVR